MRPKDFFALALGAMADRKTRTALTIIGLIIGPAAIVALVGATQGYSNAAAAEFDKLGATTIFVSSGLNLTQGQVNQIRALPGVSAAVPYDELTGTINVAGTQQGVSIIATDIAELSAVFPSLSLSQGSIPLSTDTTAAVVGASVAHPGVSGATNLTVNQVLTVSQIRAQNQKFSVIGGGVTVSGSGGPGSGASAVTRLFIVSGIYGTFGQGIANIDPDSTIFVPVAVAQSITDVYTYNDVLVKASSASLVSKVASEITNLFGSKNVDATTLSSFLSVTQSLSQGVGTLLEAVAGISVLVAFIGILTTMFTSVLERTKEIGIMKALGASGRSIMSTFLSEALLTGFIGGLVGAGAGSALSFLVIILLRGSSATGPTSTPELSGSGGTSPSSSAALSITPAITPELLLAAVALATVVGMLAGLYPAWRASKLPPVEALRSS